jgi:hypothetical protein
MTATMVSIGDKRVCNDVRASELSMASCACGNKYSFWLDKQSHNRLLMYVCLAWVRLWERQMKQHECASRRSVGQMRVPTMNKKENFTRFAFYLRAQSRLKRPLARSCLVCVRVRGILGGDFRHKRGFGRKVDSVRFGGDTSVVIMVTTT